MYKDAKKFKIDDTARFRELKYFALQYWDFKRQLEEKMMLGSPNIDGMPRSDNPGDPTGRIATDKEYVDIYSKITLIEECARNADADIWKAVLYAVTHENISYNFLLHKGLLKDDKGKHYGKKENYGQNKFFLAKRKFYWLLDKRKNFL